jgi:hypothetical protein
MPNLRLLVSGALVCAARVASAAPIPENEMANTLPQNSSSHTAEKANPTTMPWCVGRYSGDSWATDRFQRVILSYHDFDNWADAAEHLCEHKEDPTWQRQAMFLVQVWMNANENSQPEAEKQIAEKIAALKVERSPAGQAKAAEKEQAFSEGELDEEKPAAGVDQARIGAKPAWCDAAGKTEGWKSGRIHRTFASGNGIQGVIEAMRQICERPTDTTWKQEAGYMLQRWMNWTHLSQADAEKSIRARIQTAKFSAQHDELCKALELSPEVAGQEQAYGEARLLFFGCKNENQTLWQDRSAGNPTGVGFYLDGDTQTDELMRAFWLFTYLHDPWKHALPANSADENLPLLYYAIAQSDVQKLDRAAIAKTLAEPPYSEYAQTVAMETLGVLKAEQAAYEKAIDKMTKGDEDYAAILRAAPKKALAQWDAMFTQWKPEIERSAAFEKLLSKPSRKALKGCSANLFKDGEKVVKSLKTTSYKELVDKISGDPVANLILGRIAVCYAADKVWGGSGALRDLVTKGRDLRGPRSLTYYAVVDAIAEAKKDRPKLLFDLSGFFLNGGALSGGFEPPGKDLDFNGRAPREWEKTDNKGVVASTKKVEDGLQIVFKKVTLRYENYDCKDDTRHPLRINSDGRIEYYRNCKPLGTFSTQDETPHSVVISPLLGANVKPGVFLQYVEASTNAKNGDPFGAVVFTKKTAEDKKIASFFGFAL